MKAPPFWTVVLLPIAPAIILLGMPVWLGMLVAAAVTRGRR